MSSRVERRVAMMLLVVLVVATGVAISGVADSPGDASVQRLTDDEELQQTTTANQTGPVSLENLTAPKQVIVGTNYTVSATLVNTGDDLVRSRVYYGIAGNVIASTSVRISPNAEMTVQFNVTENDTAGFPTGTFTHGVFTENESVTANVTLVEETETPTEPTPTTATETTTTATTIGTTTAETTPTTEITVATNATTTTAEQTTTEITERTTTTTTETNVTTTATTTTAETTTTGTTTETTTAATTTAQAARTANIVFKTQDTRGQNITVSSVTVPKGGFVVIHDSGIVEGEVVESIVGRSDYLDPGTHRNVTITLDERLNESQRFFTVVYRDTNDNREFDFVESNRRVDGPYTKIDSPEAVNAIALVEVVDDTANETATTTANQTG